MATTRWLLLTALAIGTLFSTTAGTSPAGAETATGAVALHWGSFFGGDGATDTLRSPALIGLPDRVVQVASSNSTQYALLANGQVYAWGLGGNGQLGDGRTVDSLTAPVRVKFPAGVRIAALPTDAMPYNTGLAVDTTGRAWGWGLNAEGSLCLGRSTNILKPVKLPFRAVTALAGAGDHAQYDSDGTVYACGGNHNGDLGNGTTVASRVPVRVRGLSDRSVRTLVASFNDSGALLANGTYLDWGFDGQGQLGDGTIGGASTVPVPVQLPLPVTQVAQGGSTGENGQTLVILSNGSLRAWGADEFGQLGDQGTVAQPSPVAFSAPAGMAYSQVASGGGTSYALTAAGVVYSWGNGMVGQIGNGKPVNQSKPTLVQSGASLISATANDVVIN